MLREWTILYFLAKQNIYLIYFIITICTSLKKKSNPIFVSFCVNWRMESQIYLFLK